MESIGTIYPPYPTKFMHLSPLQVQDCWAVNTKLQVDHTFSLVTDTRQYIQFCPLPRQYIQSWSPFPRAFIQSGPRYQTICTFSLIPFTRSYIQSGPHLGYQTILLVGSNSPDHIFSRVQFTRSYIQSGLIYQSIYLVRSNLPDHIFSQVQFTRSYIQSGPIHQIIYLVWSNSPDHIFSRVQFTRAYIQSGLIYQTIHIQSGLLNYTNQSCYLSLKP